MTVMCWNPASEPRERNQTQADVREAETAESIFIIEVVHRWMVNVFTKKASTTPPHPPNEPARHIDSIPVPS